ncbi:LLM class flavin-dependent oxidoreductase [Streptomyces sp. PRh5]|uniref:LLM class flavin-dependent oxidoreductase n=1 Tax=Streptomyces sp. PRh5 TaxID=1158056 RepID=UPI002410083E|nr:LLM class flavin-dependent oxidoreductase [Streptomyces sp. PRh5]
MELTDLLLRGHVDAYEGEHFTARDVRMRPGCVQMPRVPLAIAATGPRGMRLAARHADIWITVGEPGVFEPRPVERTLPLLKKQVAALDEACEAEGRDPTAVDRVVLTGAMVDGLLDSADAFMHAEGLLGEIGFTDLVVHWLREDFPYRERREVLEEIAAAVLSGANVPPSWPAGPSPEAL